ncbi:hypothetical protein AVEN_153992-1 [Araneus ventricosus]|uniref:Uncharacterized protein n=1 Tax=Araneus ventricosus TaxID=182803 RepID=A0A4Y2CZ00_ARAVE|nr:hypothetical protein AVEN_69035-1 [Araneus ventricosus]GBM09712.1 hypothetical protein AVEN_153992-1 [Araneus ventricosus]
MWLQEEAPVHFCLDVQKPLYSAYRGRWTWHGGPIRRPPTSPDISYFDLFFSVAIEDSRIRDTRVVVREVCGWSVRPKCSTHPTACLQTLP